jgi:hypothetical protein
MLGEKGKQGYASLIDASIWKYTRNRKSATIEVSSFNHGVFILIMHLKDQLWGLPLANNPPETIFSLSFGKEFNAQ